MRGRMTEKRKLELQTIRKEKLLSLIVGNFKYATPLIAQKLHLTDVLKASLSRFLQ
jgi:hypothetical protein